MHKRCIMRAHRSRPGTAGLQRTAAVESGAELLADRDTAPGGVGQDLSRVPASTGAQVLPKLEINTPGDSLEVEADRMADQVMRKSMSSAPEQVQRRCSTCEAEDKLDEEATHKRLGKGDQDDNLAALLGPQAGVEAEAGAADLAPPEEEEKAVAKTARGLLRKESGAAAAQNGGSYAPTIVHKVLRSGGRPLDPGARSFMERSFGHDFSRVRVHTDSQASASAESIRAHAYTVGSDIVFRAGRYDTGSQAGQRLLAHELTHVVQQGASAPLARTQPAQATAAPVAVSRSSARVQRAIATSIAADGAASNALGACDWGLTFPETVDETCVAKKSGATWKADVTALKGHYSEQTRLLPSEKEVTGPAGNTTAANYCEQVGELKALGNCPGKWYMLAAVKAHEDQHATRFLPALNAVAPAISTEFAGVTVPDASGKTAATALTEIKALPAYATAKGNMQPKWLAEILTRVAHDHDAGGVCQTAEHGVVDPMVTRICSHAKTKSWAACADCPP